jgi:hypothetical protein
VYVTTRPHGFPHRDEAALAATFGAEAAAILKSRVDALLGELFGMPPPWLGRTEPMELIDLFRAAEAAVETQHPELDPEAVAALANYYTYCNK